ncbi:phage major capsid protein, partial [Intestinibacter sp.]|uniref:phage major capsid protein n=1 Tax=Intestinibacter sp. TaxID=1965304 RepID=UPI002A763C70
MALLGNKKLKQQEVAAKMQSALAGGNEEEIKQAWTQFQEAVVEDIKADFLEYQVTQDKTILVQRGYRQLTSAEEKYYQRFIEAAKSPNPKQAFIDMSALPDGVMPETIVEDVFRELTEEHPLLDKINFTYCKYLTKWILNDHTIDTAVWGELNSAITKEITSAFKVIDITQNKLSAFAAIPLDMLDLGPTFLDSYIRTVLKDALLCGLEKAIVAGTGKNQPIGLCKDVSHDVSVSGGVYPDKTKVKLTSFMPKEYGTVLAKLAKTEEYTDNDGQKHGGRSRKFGSVLFICNQTDYLTKVMPASTVLNVNGTFTQNVFPFPTEVVISNELADGTAIVCLPNEYFMAIGGPKEGIITYSDEYKFLEDLRYFKIKTYGAGKANDDTVALFLDISNLEELYITTKA